MRPRRCITANRPPRLPAAVKPLVREVIATFERTVRPVTGTSRRLTAPTPRPLRGAAPGPKNEGTLDAWLRGRPEARRLQLRPDPPRVRDRQGGRGRGRIGGDPQR